MANVKNFRTAKIATGLTVYAYIQRDVDGHNVDDSDGAFASHPADPYIDVGEDGWIKGLYLFSEARAAWEPGWYSIFFYVQSGGSPDPVSDTIGDMIEVFIIGDQVVKNFPYEYGAVVDHANNAANTFETDLGSATNDYCLGSFIKFVSGALVNQVRRITAFNASSNFVTLSSAFTAEPTAGDEFMVVNQ